MGQAFVIQRAQLIVEIDVHGFSDDELTGDGELPARFAVGLTVESNGTTVTSVTALLADEPTGMYGTVLEPGSFESFTPSQDSLPISLQVTDWGDLARGPGEQVDLRKVKDVHIVLDYFIPAR